MSNQRKYNPEFKAKVVIEALERQKSVAQICREYDIAEDLLCHWRQIFLQRAPQIFATDRARLKEQSRMAELERMVGKLTMELDISKKALNLSNSRRNGGRNW